ncbi:MULTISPECIES: hypothetical protein [Streptomyces]|uniref:hypothetical protein n=1 Tax=Streptomyces TaxID=1883 RepID=UPI001030AC52|nr:MULTISPECIES: hypothetical protein [Streptomyces]
MERPATARATPPDPPPVHYRLITPQEWYQIPLAPGERERSVNALVDRQFQGQDDAAAAKHRVRGQLLEQAESAFRNHGVELYLSLQSVGPVTVPASLLVTFVPGHTVPCSSLEELAERAGGGDLEVESTLEELPSGPAVRVRRREEPVDGSPADVEPPVAVDYYLPIPGTDDLLLLSFSTPLPAIADALVQLFDAVARSFAWTGPDRT